MPGIDKPKVVALLNKILETELAGVVRYTHYSLMVFGYNRIPIVSWLEQQATESMTHARAAGELVTQLGAHPSLAIGPLLETHRHDIGDILRESLGHEKKTLVEYENLLELVQGNGLVVEDIDVEKLAMNSTLGRLWRSWRKLMRIGTRI